MYKVFIKQICDGEQLGIGQLVEEFDTLKDAIAAGKSECRTKEDEFMVREYDDARKVNIYSNSESDTGTVVAEWCCGM